MKKAVLIALRIVLAAIFIVAGVSKIVSALNRQSEQREMQKQIEQASVNELKSAYDRLEIGMSYEDCVSIIGVEGDLFSETESQYFGKSSVYLWSPEDALFTGIEAHFDDGALSEKTWVD